MRKRALMLLCSLLLLSGCGVTQKTVIDDMTTTIRMASRVDVNVETNRHRQYFDYYLPRGIGQRVNPNLDVENAEFILNNTSFYMSLDIAEVIINEYYDRLLKYKIQERNDIMKVGETLINRTGELENYANVMRNYSIIVNKLNEEDYFIYVSYGDVYFVALSPLSEINDIVYSMLVIGRSVHVDSELVLINYSNKVNVVIEQSYDLFEKVFPESGIVADVLSDKIKGPNNDQMHEAEETLGDGYSEEDITEEDIEDVEEN